MSYKGLGQKWSPERGALGLQIPETVKLAQPLVEESLALGLLGGHGKVHLWHAFHEVGSLARALVESFPVSGMPGGHGSIVVLLLGDKRPDEQSDQDDNRPWMKKPKRILHEIARIHW